MVSELISWKHSFDRINEEYEIVKRKKQALDDLLNTGKISQSTYDSFNHEMDNAVAEIEKQQKALLEKMNSKVNDLEQQVKILETLLANFEIKHVTGEIDEEIYQRKTELLSIGLETARQELDVTKESVNQFSGDIQTTEEITPPPTPETVTSQEIENQPAEEVTAYQPEVEVVEETVSTDDTDKTETEGAATEEADEQTVEESPEYPVASVETGEATAEAVEETAEENVEAIEETAEEYPSESSTESEVGETESLENPQQTLQNPEEFQLTETEEETQEE
jgi:hypothetical protein